VGNIFTDVDFLRHFTAHTSIGGAVDYTYNNAFAPTPYENAENNTAANLYQETWAMNNSFIWTNTLKYANEWGKSNLSVLGGEEYIYEVGRANQTTRGNYYITDSSNLTVSPNLWTLNFGAPSTQTNNSNVPQPNYNNYNTPIGWRYIPISVDWIIIGTENICWPAPSGGMEPRYSHLAINTVISPPSQAAGGSPRRIS